MNYENHWCSCILHYALCISALKGHADDGIYGLSRIKLTTLGTVVHISSIVLLCPNVPIVVKNCLEYKRN